jgi:hypothetical protein
VRDRPILDDAAVDEDVLHASRRRPVGRAGQRRNVAGHAKSARTLVHLDEIITIAINLVQPIPHRSCRRVLQCCATRAGQGKARLRIRERELRHDFRHLRRLGAVGLQELPARRQIVEKVVDLDHRALGSSDLPCRCNRPPVHPELGAALLASRARP